MTKAKATNDPLYRILHDQPNEWQTAPEFWGMALAHKNWRGNFFALKNRGLSLSAPVRELIPLAPGIVEEVKQNPDYSLTYKCTFPDGTQKNIPGSEIAHFRGLSLNGYMGLSPISYMRETIGLAMATQEYGARFFGQGTHPGIIVTHPGTLSSQGSENLSNSLSERYSGLGKAHRLMLLEEGMKAEKLTIDPQDAQFLETRKFQKSEIVDIFFAMPLTVLHSGDSTPTYASAEQFSLNFVIYALMPDLVNFESAIKRDLLSESQKKNMYAKFQAGALMRGTAQDRGEFYIKMVNAEIFSPNECRELEDMNPYEGGDVYRTRTSTTKDNIGVQTGDKKNGA